MKHVIAGLAIVVENMSTIDRVTPPTMSRDALDAMHGDDVRLLITRRSEQSVLAGYWEFPGGKVEPGESHAQCIEREMREEVGIDVELVYALDPIEHQYEHACVRLLPYLCGRVSGLPQPRQVDAVRWVSPSELGQYQFPQGNTRLIHDMQSMFAGAAHDAAAHDARPSIRPSSQS